MGIGDRGNDLGAMVDAIALELFWSQNEKLNTSSDWGKKLEFKNSGQIKAVK
jgi:hypothetical protein